jgi:hypothetical protein
MDRTTAQTLLKRYGFDNSDPLNSWLDEGQEMVEDAHDWPFLQFVATINAVAGASTLVLPSDFFKVQSIRDVTHGGKLAYMDIEGFEREVDDPTVPGKPYLYTVTGTQTIQLYPVLDSDTLFRVVYQRRLTLVSTLASDGTPLDGDAHFHYPVVLAAAFTALMAENEEKRAQTALGQFDNAVEQRWQKYSSVQIDEPEQVVDVMGYGST